MHKSESTTSNNAIVVNDPLSQLREVESAIQLMLETREYIENHPSAEVKRGFVEAEKAVDKARKQVRYEKKRKQETELLLAR